MTDETPRKPRKRKRSRMELREKDLPPALAVQRECILRDLEHNAVFRLMHYRRVRVSAMGTQQNWARLREIRELYGTQRVPLFYVLLGLSNDDLRELHFTGVDAEDYFAALWGSRCLQSSRFSYQFMVASLMAIAIGLWMAAVVFRLVPLPLAIVSQVIGWVVILNHHVRSATPYHTYKMLATTLEMGVTPPLHYFARHWKGVAVRMLIVVTAIIILPAGVEFIGAVKPVVRLLQAAGDFMGYVLSMPTAGAAVLRMAAGLLPLWVADVIGRTIRNRLVRRGAPDLELAVRRIGMLKDMWWDMEPFGDRKKSDKLSKLRKQSSGNE